MLSAALRRRTLLHASLVLTYLPVLVPRGPNFRPYNVPRRERTDPVNNVETRRDGTKRTRLDSPALERTRRDDRFTTPDRSHRSATPRRDRFPDRT